MLDKNFSKPRYLCILEIFNGINFHQCSRGHHILYVIINTGKKSLRIKISAMRAGGKIGENFLLAKISTYTVDHLYTSTGQLMYMHTYMDCSVVHT